MIILERPSQERHAAGDPLQDRHPAAMAHESAHGGVAEGGQEFGYPLRDEAAVGRALGESGHEIEKARSFAVGAGSAHLVGTEDPEKVCLAGLEAQGDLLEVSDGALGGGAEGEEDDGSRLLLVQPVDVRGFVVVVRQAERPHGTDVGGLFAHCLHCVPLELVWGVDDYPVGEDVLLRSVLDGSQNRPVYLAFHAWPDGQVSHSYLRRRAFQARDGPL